MRNGLLALGQLSPQSTPLNLGAVEYPSFDAVEDGPHAAEGVVVGEVELCRRVVALLGDRVAAIPPVLYFPFRRVFLGTRYPRREILEDHCLSVGVFPCHIPRFLGSYFRSDLLCAVHWVVDAGLHWEALGDVGYRARQVDL
jgi:hypothetical protein